MRQSERKRLALGNFVVDLRWFWSNAEAEMGIRALNYDGTGGGDPTQHTVPDHAQRAVRRYRAIERVLSRLTRDQYGTIRAACEPSGRLDKETRTYFGELGSLVAALPQAREAYEKAIEKAKGRHRVAMATWLSVCARHGDATALRLRNLADDAFTAAVEAYAREHASADKESIEREVSDYAAMLREGT